MLGNVVMALVLMLLSAAPHATAQTCGEEWNEFLVSSATGAPLLRVERASGATTIAKLALSNTPDVDAALKAAEARAAMLETRVQTLEARVAVLEARPTGVTVSAVERVNAKSSTRATASCDATGGEIAVNCSNEATSTGFFGQLTTSAVINGNTCTCSAQDNESGSVTVKAGQCKISCLKIS